MKIMISLANATAGGPPTVHVLGDDATRAFISGWAPAAAAQVQTSRPPRASAVTKYSRSNVETVMPFIVSRGHANRSLALLFAAQEVAEKTKLQGDVTVSEFGGSGATLRLTDAVIAAVNIVNEINGVETVLAYRIEGGAFTFNSTS